MHTDMINYSRLYKFASTFLKMADGEIPTYYVDSLEERNKADPSDQLLGTAPDSKGVFYDCFRTKSYTHYKVLNRVYTEHGTQEGKF